jgi:hypothetical protein
MRTRNHAHQIASFVVLLFGSKILNAAAITYSIDPSQSTIALSGSLDGRPLQTNSFGSSDSSTVYDGFHITYAGTISAIRDTVADTLQIVEGHIDAANNTMFLSYPPTPPAPSNYSFFITTADSSGSLFEGAIRNLSFSISSPAIASPASFDASLITASVTSGQVDFAFISSGIESDFSTNVSSDLSLTPETGTVVDDGYFERLTIPFDTDLTVLLNGDPLSLNLSGNLVAVSNAPEPSSAALLCVATIPFVRRRKR